MEGGLLGHCGKPLAVCQTDQGLSQKLINPPCHRMTVTPLHKHHGTAQPVGLLRVTPPPFHFSSTITNDTLRGRPPNPSVSVQNWHACTVRCVFLEFQLVFRRTASVDPQPSSRSVTGMKNRMPNLGIYWVTTSMLQCQPWRYLAGPRLRGSRVDPLYGRRMSVVPWSSVTFLEV